MYQDTKYSRLIAVCKRTFNIPALPSSLDPIRLITRIMAAISLFRETNMAAISLFWETNMAAVTSHEKHYNVCHSILRYAEDIRCGLHKHSVYWRATVVFGMLA